MNGDKTRVAVLFGGRSTEHEISVISALQAMDAFDSTRFDLLPIYVDLEGKWFTGEVLCKRENFPLSSDAMKQCVPVFLNADSNWQITAQAKAGGWFKKDEPQRFPVDVFFPAFHGTYGEDGCIQGLFEWIGAPYVGSGPCASSIGMNKHLAKKLVSQSDVPVLSDLLIHQSEWDPNQAHILAQSIAEQIPSPWMVKPCNLGSSIAISSAHTQEELMVSLAGAFAFDDQVMVEPLIEDMYELNIAVLFGEPPKTSAVERPRREDTLLTFEDKYMKGNKKISDSQSEGMASLQRDLNPADVPEAMLESARNHAVSAYSTMGCRGVVRFDFIVNNQESEIYFNEANLIPGSFSYYLWEKAEPRISFTELLSILVDQALAEHKAKRRLRRQVEMRVL
ncbi:MAG: D-alanine--D-alanine ligase [Candidatus Hinthialibacter antarcticus]|nr:D-alanine--D-alanine ligase [Candidatus Hinthialibacter antarcticus]